MKRLVELARKIKNKKLRKKVIDFIKNPELSHREMKKYPKMDIKTAKTPFTVGGSSVERDVLNHTIALTGLCIKTADHLKEHYNLELNKDHLIAASILHDIMKIYEWKRSGDSLEPSGISLDHTMLGVSELYHRDLPEGVIHIVASHFGEGGPTPPRNFEALVFHYLDTLLSLTEHHILAMKSQKTQIPMIVLDEEAWKRLGEKSEK